MADVRALRGADRNRSRSPRAIAMTAFRAQQARARAIGQAASEGAITITKYLISVSWPKGAPRDQGLESTVELDALDPVEAKAQAQGLWPEHDIVAVTQAELQLDGRWTFPREGR